MTNPEMTEQEKRDFVRKLWAHGQTTVQIGNEIDLGNSFSIAPETNFVPIIDLPEAPPELP